MSYLQKSQKWVYFFPLILTMQSSLQMCCNPTVCCKIRVIKFNFCCNSMISQHLQNFGTQFSQKQEVGSYDNIVLNQRDMFLTKSVAFINLSCQNVNNILDTPGIETIQKKPSISGPITISLRQSRSALTRACTPV